MLKLTKMAQNFPFIPLIGSRQPWHRTSHITFNLFSAFLDDIIWVNYFFCAHCSSFEWWKCWFCPFFAQKVYLLVIVPCPTHSARYKGLEAPTQRFDERLHLFTYAIYILDIIHLFTYGRKILPANVPFKREVCGNILIQF